MSAPSPSSLGHSSSQAHSAPFAVMSAAGPMLDRVADLSAIRDADLLDLSLLRTVREVCAPGALSLLRLAADGTALHESHLRDDGSLCQCGEPALPPAMLALLAEEGVHGLPLRHDDADTDGSSLYPVLDARGIRTWLRVLGPAPGPQVQALIHGFVRFFQNYRGLLDDAQRDALTGLRNRKTFDDIVLRLSAAQAANDPSEAAPQAWLGILDIDHFKRINDGFGHLYGDEVLLLLAQLMQRSFRGQDLLFRFGGEEFVILLRDADRATAGMVFERFRSEVEQFAFPQVGRVTVSIGIVALTPGRMTSLMLDEADKALYWAKQHGRNRLAAYEDLVERGELVAAAPQTGSVDLF